MDEKEQLKILSSELNKSVLAIHQELTRIAAVQRIIAAKIQLLEGKDGI